MSFQIKDFASIVASEINHARSVTKKVTDFAPGSVFRTLLEAPANELEQLYLQYFIGLREAIPVSTFLSFGFDLLPAAYAAGSVYVSVTGTITQAITIPIGADFYTADGRHFAATQTVAWQAGTNVVRIPVRAAAAGAAYNVPSGAISKSPFFSVGYTITNPAFTTGRDIEQSIEREARFAAYIESLSRGTVQACSYAVGSAAIYDVDGNITEYVTRVGVSENPGRVLIYAYGSGGLASNALLNAAQAMLDGNKNNPGYSAAGVRVEALRMIERAVSASFSVGMLQGYQLTETVQGALTSAFQSGIAAVQPGEVLYIGDLIKIMLAVPGVASIIPTSNANIVCAPNEVLVSGALTYTAL